MLRYNLSIMWNSECRMFIKAMYQPSGSPHFAMSKKMKIATRSYSQRFSIYLCTVLLVSRTICKSPHPPKKQKFKQANFNWVHTVAIFISKCKRNQNYIKENRILRWFLNEMFSFLFIFGNPRILIGWVF